METISLKVLAEKVLQRNQHGNFLETQSFRAGKLEAKKFPDGNLLETVSEEAHGCCPICCEYAWWLSKYGSLVCGVCHPPFEPELVKRWIGDPECYAGLKASRPAVVLSYEECRRRREDRLPEITDLPGQARG